MSKILQKPTACIYNGCRLPILDFLDQYPYVLICKENAFQYELYCSSSPITIETDDDGDYLLVREAPHCIKYYTQYDKTWRQTSEYTSRSRTYISRLGTPVWSNRKITYPNGTVYISASNEPSALYEGCTEEDNDGIDLYSWTVGLVFALSDNLSLIENNMFENDDYTPPIPAPVAYLYHDVRLPVLPEWDKEKYPYAIINHRNKGIFTEQWVLRCYTKDAVYKISGNNTYFGNCEHLEYIITDITSSEWPGPELKESNSTWVSGTSTLYDLIWANFDVYDTNNSLILLYADPVPVYE